MILGNKIGGSRDSKTYIIQSGDSAFTGVVVERREIFDACSTDVKAGKVFACDSGVVTGTNNCMDCYVARGVLEVDTGEEFLLTLPDNDLWDYTTFDGMITKKSEPYKVIRMLFENAVYIDSGAKVSDITKDSRSKSIKLHIANNTGEPCLFYYFVYKEGAV